ncbi:TIR domain-containing protein [Actinosynnema sp. NPDC050436]|uniref:TIR domain-containing protein n=1 Tax=Actinosynnema sp. NPDC050436 TaxID=3155659 RepID=UPI0033EE9F56
MTHVFISYSRRQQGYAQELARFLREEHGLATWMDDELVIGDRWERVIRANIDRCAALVVVMTPEAEASDWVDLEITRARDLGKPVLPVLLAGTVFFRLGNLQFEDVRDGSMPGDRFIRALRRLTDPATPTAGPTTAPDPDTVPQAVAEDVVAEHPVRDAPPGARPLRNALWWGLGGGALVAALVITLVTLSHRAVDADARGSTSTTTTSVTTATTTSTTTSVTTASPAGTGTSPRSCAVGDIGVTPGTNPRVTIPDGCTPPGALLKSDLVAGRGQEVVAGAAVSFHFALVTWSDRREVDSTFNGGTPLDLEVGGGKMIPGFEEGLLGARQGGRRLIVVPPDKGYPEGAGQIPAGETLVFVVEVLSVS